MFDNRFNSKKTDPLVEAAKGAMKEGEIRRQAINAVNEEFGVYNRNAVIREHLAAYDARIEEAVKCMKEGKPLSPKQQKMASLAGDPKKIDAADLASLRKGAKIDEKKGCYEEGTAEAETSMNVTSGGKPATPAQTTSAPQNAPMPPKRPANLEEITKRTAISAYREKMAQDRDTEKLGNLIQNKWGRETAKHAYRAGHQDTVGLVRRGESHGVDRLASAKSSSDMRKTKSGKIHGQDVKSKKYEIKFRGKMSKFDKKGHLPEETIEEAVSRKHFQQVADLIKGHESQEKRNELALHHAGIFAKQNPRFDHARFHKAAGSTAHETPKKMEEAAYSAKAAREGKDIGKPGKMFSKIAKKAGERYGSEERGKKVAGAILAKIRAKHMKEDQEQIDEVVAAADLAKSGLTLGQYMNKQKGLTAVKGGKNDPSSPNFAGPKPAATSSSSSSGGDKGYTSDGGRTVSLKPTADSGTAQAAEPPKAAPAPAAQPKGWSAPKDVDQSKTVAASGGAAPADKPDTQTPQQRWDASRAATNTPAPGVASRTASAEVASGAAAAKQSSDSVAKLMKMNESVQVGANKYRIV